jgi:hypothetical protein
LVWMVPIAPGDLRIPEKLRLRPERPGDSLSAPGLAPLLRSVAPAASCASRGFWEGTGRGLGRAAAATVAHAGTLTIAQTHDEKAEIE